MALLVVLLGVAAHRLGSRTLGDYDVVAELPAVFRVYPVGSDRIADEPAAFVSAARGVDDADRAGAFEGA